MNSQTKKHNETARTEEKSSISTGISPMQPGTVPTGSPSRDDIRDYRAGLGELFQQISPQYPMDHQKRKAEECLINVGLGRDAKSEFRRELYYLFDCHSGHRSNSETHFALLKIILEQQIDAYWYRGFTRYPDCRSVLDDLSLVDFKNKETDYGTRLFQFVHLIEHWYTRIPNAAARRFRILLNHPGRNTMGLIVTRCPLAMFNLLNRISLQVAEKVSDYVPILVNSVLRTVEHQDHLAKIGYVAPTGSAHMNGYAADVEQKWYRENRPDQFAVISDTLRALHDEIVINCIDYGNIWHICLNPEFIGTYENMHEGNRRMIRCAD